MALAKRHRGNRGASVALAYAAPMTPPKTAPALNVGRVGLGTLEAHPLNPRRGDLPLIIESIRVNDFYGALVVQQSSHRIVVGNHRWLALQAAADHVHSGDPGWEHYPPDHFDTVAVIWRDLSDEQALRLLTVDNRASDAATYADDQLAAVLAVLRDSDTGFEGSGWVREELDDVLRRLNPPDFDALERRYGSADDAAKSLWPSVRLVLAPETMARWAALYAAMPGASDDERVRVLLDRADATGVGGDEWEPEGGADT